MSANCTVPLWAEAIAVVVVVVAVAVVVAVVAAVVVVVTVEVGGQVPSPFAQRTKRRSEASQGNARQGKSSQARLALPSFSYDSYSSYSPYLPPSFLPLLLFTSAQLLFHSLRHYKTAMNG